MPVCTISNGAGLAYGVDKCVVSYIKSLMNLVSAFCITDCNTFTGTFSAQNGVECGIVAAAGFVHTLGIEHGIVIVKVTLLADSQVLADDSLETKCVQLINVKKETDVNTRLNELSQISTLGVFRQSFDFFVGKRCDLRSG